MEFVKYNLLSKNKDYEGTAIADCGFAHVFSTIKKGEGPGYRVIGEALSSDLISFLQDIMRKYPKIWDTHIYPISIFQINRIEKLMEKIEKIRNNSKEVNR